jgi:hypothetical protein
VAQIRDEPLRDKHLVPLGKEYLIVNEQEHLEGEPWSSGKAVAL